MKKKLVIALCLVMSLSLLLCSCGTDNSQSDNNTDVKPTAAPTLIPQGESQSIPTTGNDDPIVTVPSISEDEIADPSEDIVTDPSEDDATEPSEVPTEPTVAPTEPTVAPTKPTVAPTKPTVAPTKPSTPTQAHKHSYTAKVTKAATCTAAGVKTYTCSGCQHQYTETIVAAGHKKDSGTVTKAATCSATGTKTYKCTVCKAIMETATIAKTAHKLEYVSTIKFANPNETGKEKQKCKTCGYTTEVTTSKITPDAGTQSFYEKNGTTTRDGYIDISIHSAYWKNGLLYIQYTIVNNTNQNYTLTGINQLKICQYQSPKVIAEIVAEPFPAPISLKAGEESTIYCTYFAAKEIFLQGYSLKQFDYTVSFLL